MSPSLNAAVDGEKSNGGSYTYANLSFVVVELEKFQKPKLTILNSICCKNFALGMMARDKIDIIATR